MVGLIVAVRKDLAGRVLDAGPDTIGWHLQHTHHLPSVTAHLRVPGALVRQTFRRTVATYGVPASTLTDNGMVFTIRLSGGSRGRNGLEQDLHRLKAGKITPRYSG